MAFSVITAPTPTDNSTPTNRSTANSDQIEYQIEIVMKINAEIPHLLDLKLSAAQNLRIKCV